MTSYGSKRADHVALMCGLGRPKPASSSADAEVSDEEPNGKDVEQGES